jgi:chromate reductase
VDLLTLCGSLRAGSYNRMLARSLPMLAPDGVRIVEAPSIATLPLYDADAQSKGFPDEVVRLGDAIRAADGVIVVTPEYNYSVPGVLKNAIDWVSRLQEQPFRLKPVLIQSVSTGMLGGARAQYHLRQTMVFLEANVFNRPEVMVGGAKGKFDESAGLLTDESTRNVVRQQLDAFSKAITGR